MIPAPKMAGYTLIQKFLIFLTLNISTLLNQATSRQNGILGKGRQLIFTIGYHFLKREYKSK